MKLRHLSIVICSMLLCLAVLNLVKTSWVTVRLVIHDSVGGFNLSAGFALMQTVSYCDRQTVMVGLAVRNEYWETRWDKR